ncbi:MAG: FG-GAP-like repeat-containing protein [Chloroflexota bacterium]|nr:FG-GAP-like repeat-containing protein [Chloroflexota bacterium]
MKTRVVEILLHLLATTIATIGIVSCASETQTPVPTVHSSPLNSPIAAPTTQVSLPENEEILDYWVGDLNSDGHHNIVMAVGDSAQNVNKVYVFTSPDDAQYTLLQEIELPESGNFHQLTVADLDLNGMYDIGVYEARPSTDQFVLFVYMSEGESFELSSPKGGVLGGEIGFTSLAEPPIVKDIDQEGAPEIVVFIEGTSEGYLASRAYSWDGESFSYADYLYLPGRRRP